jgi:uncharacterized protein (TIGR02466 family)
MKQQVENQPLMSCWPTNIYTWKIIDSELLDQCLKQALDLIPDSDTIKNAVNNATIRPWSSDDLLHLNKEWEPLTNLILFEVNRVLDHNGIIRDDAYISSMWLNAAYQHNNHIAHTHPNSIYSGVIYLQCPKDSQHLIFFDPRPQTSVMQMNSPIENSYASIDPSVGIMALWPSWLVHSTQSLTSNQLDEPRLSIAFNIMIKSNIDIPNARINLT